MNELTCRTLLLVFDKRHTQKTDDRNKKNVINETNHTKKKETDGKRTKSQQNDTHLPVFLTLYQSVNICAKTWSLLNDLNSLYIYCCAQKRVHWLKMKAEKKNGMMTTKTEPQHTDKQTEKMER